MKKIIYTTVIAAGLLFSSCGEEFLEREDLYTVSSGSFYSTPKELTGGLAASYNQLASSGGNNNATFLANLLSDDCFGGGGPDNIDFQNTDGFRNTLDSQYELIWKSAYAGIVRANLVIENINKPTYEDEADRNQAYGEALFLRAFFHFRLTQLFGQVTLKASSAPSDDTNTPFDDIYASIAGDLKLAIEIMPNIPKTAIPEARSGHATKWAAEALMARVFLFYTGYHAKTEIVLNDGTSVSKAMVTTWIDDCIDNSGHQLVSDFRNLWPYASTADDLGEFQYPYAINEGLAWEGDGNIETVFAVKYSQYGSHGSEFDRGDLGDNASPLRYGNQLVLYSAMRAQEDGKLAFPFGMGWGGAPASPVLFDSYEEADLRKIGSICDVNNADEGNIAIDGNYESGKWDFQQETFLTQKKYTPILANSEKGPQGMYFVIYGQPADYQNNNMQDEVLIRYADVLLMAAELKSDVSLLNMTRTRAGLPALGSYSIEELQKERRHELAFEGIRFYDIQRWGIAEQEFGKVVNIPIMNASVEDSYTATYRPETRGLLPIPESQIAISNGGLVQNPGW